MRKLASIQIVNSVEPISGADSIEKVGVLGWWVVVKKGEFNVGDKVVYCEIDSFLPEKPEFEFLRSNSFKAAVVDAAGNVLRPAGFRVKTIKLRGQISQGICFPASIVPFERLVSSENIDGLYVVQDTTVGRDVTESLGITKWDPPPVGSAGNVKGTFPGFLTKTDETRVQSIPDVVTRHAFRRFQVTEKLDGTSFTAFLRNGEFGICSRNNLIDPDSETGPYAQIARMLDLKTKLGYIVESIGRDVAIQGEIVGPNIQGNKYKLDVLRLYVFNLIALDTGEVFNYDAMRGIIETVALAPVPLLFNDFELPPKVDDLVRLAIGTSQLRAETQREGIVLRCAAIVQDRDIGRLSFKVINPQFLLKYDE